jgi:ABC-type sugar transport system substrate-binding protein
MKKLRFLLSLTTKNNDFQLEQDASARAAAQLAGVDLDLLYADGDTITQSTQLLKAIQAESNARPDAILFEPVGGTALPQVAKAAVAAGIGWAALNCDPEYTGELRKTARAPIFSLSSDHKEIGRIQARQFAALLPRGGAVLYIQGPSENSAARDRTQGMQSALPTNIHVTALRGQWTEESAARSVASWLKLTVANKTRIDLVAAQNDAMALGARKTFAGITSLDERERWKDVPYVGVDGLAKTGQAWVRDGTLAATIVVPPNAGQAIQMLVNGMQSGMKLAERSYTTPQSLPAVEKLAPRATA